MKEVFEKIKERLGIESDKWLNAWNDASKEGTIDNYADGMNDAYDEAIKIVSEVEAEYEQSDHTDYANIELYAFWKEHQWIPCSERLPELCKEVLVTQIFDNGNCNVTNASLIPMLDGSERVKWCSYDHYISCVEAWMPLPEAYKEV